MKSVRQRYPLIFSRLDFTYAIYHNFLAAVSSHPFYRFLDYCTLPAKRTVLLRHDVDQDPFHALLFAQIQNKLGVRGTYYFRIVPESLHPAIIEEIANLGHEIGYHYEDVSLAADLMKSSKYQVRDQVAFRDKLIENAIESFVDNLAILRRYADISTICMHGSPLSLWDSRLLWTKYNYRDFGLIGEPYFDIDFKQVAYYTDTGRRWDGDQSVVRDKPMPANLAVKAISRVRIQPGEELLTSLQSFPTFHSTFDIIKAAEQCTLPERVMFTFHPQRWHDRWLPWTKELVWQNCKNVAKYGIGRWNARKF